MLVCSKRSVVSVYVGCVFMSSSSSYREEEDPGDCDVFIIELVVYEVVVFI